jgi:hypothetical protein
MKKLPPAAAAAVAAIVMTLPAAATSVAVQLNLLAGNANRQLKACGITHHYTVYRVGARVTMSGKVLPAPAGTWDVKIKLKKCLNGRFQAIWSTHARGHADGSFKASYPARRRGSFFARAYYYGVTPAVRSDKQFFRAS